MQVLGLGDIVELHRSGELLCVMEINESEHTFAGHQLGDGETKIWFRVEQIGRYIGHVDEALEA